MKFSAAIFLVVLTIASPSYAASDLTNDRILAQLDLESLKQAAAQLPQLLGRGPVVEQGDNGDQILAEIEKEITEAILNAISDDDEDLTNPEEMDRLIASLENEKDLEELSTGDVASVGGRHKRLTVDFMGMQVRTQRQIRSFLQLFLVCIENQLENAY
jgi:HPt (histidine-containing phosphotransfer) domain-containing protein